MVVVVVLVVVTAAIASMSTNFQGTLCGGYRNGGVSQKPVLVKEISADDGLGTYGCQARQDAIKAAAGYNVMSLMLNIFLFLFTATSFTVLLASDGGFSFRQHFARSYSLRVFSRAVSVGGYFFFM